VAWERARSEEQKEQRISEIVKATSNLFENQSFEEITFAAIAKEANFTRSNLYKYFNNKEEIFLELVKHDITLWENDFLDSFDTSKTYSIKEFSKLWAEIYLRNERLLNLMSILYTFIEKNSSIESIVAYKKFLHGRIPNLLNFISTVFPQMTQQKASDFFYIQLHLSSGLYPMAVLSEMHKKLQNHPEITFEKINFVEEYSKSLEYLLKGILAN